MGMTVFPDQIGLAGFQVDAVNAEILLSQGAEHFLDPKVGIIQLQTALQDFMYILDRKSVV